MLPQLGHLLLDLRQPLLGVLLGLVGQLPVGQFQLHQPPLHLVDLVRHALQLHRQPAGGLVHQVDGLVGQEAVGDVAVREVGGRHQGRVLDLDALVMGLVARLQPAEDGDRVLDRGLADEHRLEPPLQGGVLLDVLAVFVQRGGADAAQLAAGQGRLEQVGRVAAAFGPARADHRVQLVDEEDHVAGVGHFAEHGLEPLLELAAELGAGHQRAHVQGDDPLVLQALRHVAVDDPQGQPLDDGRLAHARLADQHGIVLRPPRKDLDHAADLLVAADHRVELALPGPLDQVDAVALQGLELGLGVLVGHPGAAADGLQGLQEFLLGDGVELQDAGGLGVDLGQGQQQVLGRDELVLHGVGLALGGLQHADGLLARAAAGAAGDLGEVAQLGLDDPLQLRRDWCRSAPAAGRRCLALGEQAEPAGAAARSARGRGPPASDCAAATASWALIVSLSKRKAMLGPLSLRERLVVDTVRISGKLKLASCREPLEFSRLPVFGSKDQE